jgi:hypothetical protein
MASLPTAPAAAKRVPGARMSRIETALKTIHLQWVRSVNKFTVGSALWWAVEAVSKVKEPERSPNTAE